MPNHPPLLGTGATLSGENSRELFARQRAALEAARAAARAARLPHEQAAHIYVPDHCVDAAVSAYLDAMRATATEGEEPELERARREHEQAEHLREHLAAHPDDPAA